MPEIKHFVGLIVFSGFFSEIKVAFLIIIIGKLVGVGSYLFCIRCSATKMEFHTVQTRFILGDVWHPLYAPTICVLESHPLFFFLLVFLFRLWSGRSIPAEIWL